MLLLPLIMRWMHIFGAIILVGGSIFVRCAYAPVDGADPEQQDWVARTRKRWARLVMLSAGLLLISGVVNLANIVTNYDLATDRLPGSLYHPIFGIKFLLALVVFFLSSRLAGSSAGAERFRQRETLWSNLNLIAAVLVVCLAGWLKLAERTPKVTESQKTTAAARTDAAVPRS